MKALSAEMERSLEFNQFISQEPPLRLEAMKFCLGSLPVEDQRTGKVFPGKIQELPVVIIAEEQWFAKNDMNRLKIFRHSGTKIVGEERKVKPAEFLLAGNQRFEMELTNEGRLLVVFEKNGVTLVHEVVSDMSITREEDVVLCLFERRMAGRPSFLDLTYLDIKDIAKIA